ncbi:unnamed protein product [Vitrella brassicaformis CCMP3155]|uniref:Fe2OG dioxygenase domain-containing protein n=1 Tax=Vitrella brassicaformis (strain CCMP3155) TaxID=1169540 RepID=A0A0G4EEB6_VITBC|nr:unnamed protein product [Vitrella brassicaformis CCMP3155]|eukprot:CEL93721.1 unnamed protein product [Vitrella brassicaformis CCMP3155]
MRICDGAFALPLFSPSFCRRVCEALERHETTEAAAASTLPNGLTNYGYTLSQVDELQQLLPSSLLHSLTEDLIGCLFDGGKEGYDPIDHHSYAIRYRVGEDTNLKMHQDDSDYTLNVCLRNTGRGGHLVFLEGRHDDTPRVDHQASHSYVHREGWEVLHRGDFWHSVRTLNAGERVNIVVWCLSRPSPSDPADWRRAGFYADLLADLHRVRQRPRGVTQNV